MACLCDYLGREADAVPYYRAALRGDVAPADQRSAYLGLGSTYRTLGRHADAKATPLAGTQQDCRRAIELYAEDIDRTW